METIANNRLIAEFMGVKPIFNSYTNEFSLSNQPWWIVTGETPEQVMKDATKNFKYHSDWNELMEVVEMIESIGYDTTMKQNELIIWDTNEDPIIDCLFGETKIDAVYQSVVSFITWHNTEMA